MAGMIELFEHDKYGGKLQTLQDVTGAFTEKALHQITGELHDRVSSMKWSLPEHVVVVFHEHYDGTGHQYAIWGNGGDPNVHNHGFGDEASSWKWVRV